MFVLEMEDFILWGDDFFDWIFWYECFVLFLKNFSTEVEAE